jgi:OTU-like cysteine protease
MRKGGATPLGGMGFWCVLDLWPWTFTQPQAEPPSFPSPAEGDVSYEPSGHEQQDLYSPGHLSALLDLSDGEAVEFSENLRSLTSEEEKQDTIRALASAKSSIRVFKSSLAALGWREVNIEADGNCLFRAASYILYGSQDNHALIRRAAACCIRKHPEQCRVTDAVLKPFADSLDIYLETLMKDKEWGDDSCLRALCIIYQRHAVVYIRNHETGEAMEHPEFRTQDNLLNLELFVLANCSGVSHFNVCESETCDRLLTEPGVVESAWLD